VGRAGRRRRSLRRRGRGPRLRHGRRHARPGRGPVRRRRPLRRDRPRRGLTQTGAGRDNPTRRCPMPVFPREATDLTRLLVIADLDRAVAWYRDVLGAEIVGTYGGTSAVVRLVGCWLLLVNGGRSDRRHTSTHTRS